MIVPVIVTVLSIWAHELGHALAAHFEEDRLAARRWTYRPWVNLDPVFSVIVPLASSLVSGGAFCIGMGRPFLLSRPNLCILVWGPLVNLLLAFWLAMWSLAFPSHNDLTWLAARINFTLGLFNLLPIKPLDGWAIYAQSRFRRQFRK